MELIGIGASKGIAIGKIFIKEENKNQIERKMAENPAAETSKFEEAIKTAVKELAALYEYALQQVGEEEAQIFDVHQMLVQDLDFYDQVVALITEEKVVAEYAVQEAAVVLADIFANMEDAYMRERAADIKDISKRVINILTGNKEKSLRDIQKPTIIVAKDLYPSDTIQINTKYVLGFITEEGGKMSHSAILARTMQIPAIVGVADILNKVKEDDSIIIDGASGKIYLQPTDEEIKDWTLAKEKYDQDKKALQALKGTANVTKDGKEIEINANIGSPADIKAVLENDAQGVGLFRSEFLYMNGTKLPTEQEQFEAYKAVLEAMSERVIIRTLDVGGDKSIPYLNIPKEENPFLGYRAIRVCLDQSDMFKVQLRALLRASVYGKLGIMFPMIISLDEIIQAKSLIESIKQDLTQENIAFSQDIEIGIMIETPAAVMTSDLLAKEVDFFSIGTNDLTQYLLAVDRMNAKIAHLYDAHHPAVLKAIKMVADHAHQAGIWVGICGEAGADPSLTEFFIAAGIDELSVSPGAVLEIRRKIQSIDSKEAIEKYIK